MTLEFTLVQAPMRLGLAEGVEPHQTPFGTLTTAENVCWSKTGLLEHRLGTRAIATTIVGGGSLASASRLIVRDNELALTNGESIYSHTAAGWVLRGKVPNAAVTWETAIAELSTVKAADSVLVSDTLYEAWIQGGQENGTTNQLFYTTRSAADGYLITPTTDASGANRPYPQFRVLTYGTLVLFIFVNQSNGYLIAYDPTTATSTTLATNGCITPTPTHALDAIVVGSDIVIAYTLEAGGIGLVRASAVTVPIVAATGVVTGEASVAIGTLSIAGAAAEPLHITYITVGDATADRIMYAGANISTLVQTTAPVSHYTVTPPSAFWMASVTCTRLTATTCLMVSSYSESGYGITDFNAAIVDTAGVATYGPVGNSLCPLSKPVLIGSRYCVAVSSVTGPAGTGHGNGKIWPTSDMLIIDVTPTSDTSVEPPQIGKVEVLTGAFWAPGYTSQPTIVDADGAYRVLTPFAQDAPSGVSSTGITNVVTVGARRVSISLGTSGLVPNMWQSICVNKESYFAAGMLCSYDGAEALGYGWPFGPQINLTTESTNAAGGVMVDGTYTYSVVAERRSAAGILYRSPVADTLRETTAGGNTSIVTMSLFPPTVGHSLKSPGAFVFYRTVVDGSTPQRIGSPPVLMTLTDDQFYVPSDTVTDTQADASVGFGARLSSLAALYTVGGELEDTQPPSARTLAYHQNRIWMVAGDGSTIWISKDRTTNPEIAPGFYPTLTLTFDRQLVAMAVLDEKLVVFSEDSIWLVLGQGPGPNGFGSSYEVVSLQGDIGCANPRSVVSTPDGVMFESARGIYLLTRALELQWVGGPIQDQLVTYTNITSAVLVAKRNEVRFTADGSVFFQMIEGEPTYVDRSIVLVYNYAERQWTTSKYTVGGTYGAVIADACMWRGRWTAVTTAGIVFYEVATSFLDTPSTGSAVVADQVIETAWINQSGPLTFQSVRNFSLEGEAKEALSLTIEVAFDSEDTYAQTKTFTIAAAEQSDYEISIGTRRKCHAIRFRITATGTTTGEGLALSILGLEVGQKRGFPKKPSTRTG